MPGWGGVRCNFPKKARPPEGPVGEAWPRKAVQGAQGGAGVGGKGGEGAGQSPDAAAHPGLEEVVARRSPQPLGLGEGHPQGLREFEGRPGEQVPCRAQPEGGEQREVRRRKPRQPPQRPPAHPRPRLHPRSPLPTGPLSKKKKKRILSGASSGVRRREIPSSSLVLES